MKKNLTLISLFLFTGSANAAIELSLDFSSSVSTPEQAIAEAATEIFNGLNSIPASQRTTAQQNLWESMDYFIQNIDSTSEDVIRELEKFTRAVSPKANSANTIVTRKTPGTVSVKGIGKRLSALRKQAKRLGFAPSSPIPTWNKSYPFGFSSEYVHYNNPLEEGGLLDQRFSAFASGGVTVSQQSETGTEVGFDGNMQQLLIGADYRLNPKSFAGAAFSLTSGTIDLDNDNGQLDNASQALLFYGTYMLQPNWFVDATLNIGNRQFELERKIEFALGNTTTDVTANSSPDSSFTGISLGTGYDMIFQDGHNISLLASFDYTQSNIDSFTETDAGGFNLSVGKQTINSMQLSLGAEWRKSYSTGFGVILPQIAASWVQEFETSSDEIKAYFIADPNKNTIDYETGNKDQSYVNVKLGSSMVMPRGLSFFVQYETQQFIDDYQQHMISLGGRKEF